MSNDSIYLEYKPNCSAGEAPWSAEDEVLCSTGRTGYLQGEEMIPRTPSASHDSPLLAVLLCFVVIVLLNYHHCNRMFKNLQEDLIGVRRRANAFDDHTANEVRVSFILILQLCVCQSLLLFYHFNPISATIEVINEKLLWITLCTVGLYVFQTISYAVVGNVFADKSATRLWLRGYNISASITSLILVFPAFFATFYPSTAKVMIIIGLIAFLMVKMMFIVKGFRIFYDKFYTLLYFILYLCTLEIIPLIVIYAEVGLLCR